MKTVQIKGRKKDIIVHDFGLCIKHTLDATESELCLKNAELIRRYDKVMVRKSLAEGTITLESNETEGTSKNQEIFILIKEGDD